MLCFVSKLYFCCTTLLLGSLVAGCSVSFSSKPAAGKCTKSPEDHWASVLSTVVDSTGKVNFSAVALNPTDLECYVAYLQETAPWNQSAAFESKAEQTAFFINAYNALAMFGIVKKGIPADFDSDLKRADFFYLTNYTLGGKTLSLYQFENEVVRPLGEPRVHFALNCMSVGCPRLPTVPYTAEALEQQLQNGATEFFNSSKYVLVDAVRKVVTVSEILKFYPDDFVKPGIASSLIEFINKYRDESIPSDYQVEYIPYDWHVNKQ